MSKGPIRVLLPCDGAEVPPKLAAVAWDRQQPLTSIDAARNINLVIESLYGKVFGKIDGRAADLIRIATYCYAADQYISRGGAADVHRDRWRRKLTLCIGVNDPAFWGSESVMQALTASLAFATDDEWTFAFSHAPALVGLSQLSLELDDRELLGNPDTIVLFSGGTDSLCATVDAIAAGKKPLIVSHTPANHIGARIDDLLDGLREAYAGTWEFPQLAFDIHRAKKEPEGSSQRTRAFLYAALGVATALQLGLTEVILADNGYVSLNPPISGQIVGAIASHGTHPAFLRLMNVLLAHFGDQPPRLTNILADSTRAEAFIRLKDRNLASLLRRTHSCGKSLRKDEHPHCGYCSQCVDRRFAFLASGLTEIDASTRYTLDIFVDALPRGEARMVSLSYAAFAQEINALSDEQVLEQYQELLERGIDIGVRMQVRMLRAARLLKRHAVEVLAGLQLKIAESSEALAHRSLPEDCLLRLTLAEFDEAISFGEEMPSTQEPRMISDPLLEINPKRGLVFLLWEQPPPEAYRLLTGHQYLRLLLTHRNQPIPAMQLQRLGSGTMPAEQKVELASDGYTSSLDIDTADEGFAELGEGFHPDHVDQIGSMMSQDHVDQYRLKMATLEKLRAKAIADRKQSLALDYERQRLEIKDLLRKVVGLSGRLRPDPSDKSEQARKNVSRAIHLVIRQIADVQPDLADHLLNSLHLGTSCSYQPDPPKHWRTAA